MLEAYKKVNVTFGDQVRVETGYEELIIKVIHPKDVHFGINNHGDKYVYGRVIDPLNSSHDLDDIDGWTPDYCNFIIINNSNCSNETSNQFCVCGGPEKEYVGFNSRIMICSACEKDKRNA
jgi:hypothetical protein